MNKNQIMMMFKDSSTVVKLTMDDIILSYEKEIQLTELNKIRLPYATLHTLKNSLMSVNDSLINLEYREDDKYITA
jgi:hypothetical protein